MVKPNTTVGYMVKPYMTMGYMVKPYITMEYMVKPYITMGYMVRPYMSMGYVVKPYITIGYMVKTLHNYWIRGHTLNHWVLTYPALSGASTWDKLNHFWCHEAFGLIRLVLYVLYYQYLSIFW